MEAVRKVQLAAPAVPLVVLTGLDDEASAIQALHAGAQDYLIKGQMNTSLLVRALRYALERHGLQMALRKESTIDELTGLANRRGFLMLAEQHAMLAKRTGEHFVVAFIDMDRFKPINDTLGHQAGDAAIAEIADVLRVCFRDRTFSAASAAMSSPRCCPPPSDNSEASIRQRLSEELQTRNAQTGSTLRPLHQRRHRRHRSATHLVGRRNAGPGGRADVRGEAEGAAAPLKPRQPPGRNRRTAR